MQNAPQISCQDESVKYPGPHTTDHGQTVELRHGGASQQSSPFSIAMEEEAVRQPYPLSVGMVYDTPLSVGMEEAVLSAFVPLVPGELEWQSSWIHPGG